MNADATDREFRAYWDAHRPDPSDPSSGYCKCGGQWVFFDPENVEGCEVAGPPPIPEEDEYVG